MWVQQVYVVFRVGWETQEVQELTLEGRYNQLRKLETGSQRNETSVCGYSFRLTKSYFSIIEIPFVMRSKLDIITGKSLKKTVLSIKTLLLEKSWSSRRSMKEFPQKESSRISLDPLIQKVDAYGTTDSYPGSCHPNIVVRPGLDLQSQRRSYASWSVWRPYRSRPKFCLRKVCCGVFANCYKLLLMCTKNYQIWLRCFKEKSKNVHWPRFFGKRCMLQRTIRYKMPPVRLSVRHTRESRLQSNGSNSSKYILFSHTIQRCFQFLLAKLNLGDHPEQVC